LWRYRAKGRFGVSEADLFETRQ